MFMPGKPVYEEGGTKNFANPREGMASPLAKKLFLIDGVTSVFFGQDFVTVTKSEDHEWGTLKPEVFAAIMDFYASGEPIITDEAEMANAGTAITADDDEIVAMIKELLETRIRPAVAEDGGDIVFKGWNADTGVVTVKMQGACDGCPSSSVTLKSGIENMLRHYVPEVNSVEQEVEEGEGMDLLDMATMNGREVCACGWVAPVVMGTPGGKGEGPAQREGPPTTSKQILTTMNHVLAARLPTATASVFRSAIRAR